jgi:arylsulfatase A-like enzyme
MVLGAFRRLQDRSAARGERTKETKRNGRPNIDRIAEEGMRFTDSYGEQSCTAGRAAFITGQSCVAPA